MAENLIIAKEEKQQVLAIRIAIWASFVLFFISFTAAIATDSITLLLDAANCLVTLVVAFLIRIIIKTLNKPPDDLYNFGYGKYEPLAVAMQGALIIIVCLVCIKFAIQDIVHAEDIVRYDIPAIASFCSGVIAITVSFYLKKTALNTNSPILETAGLQWIVDGVLAFAVCIGFTFGFFIRRLGYTNITPYLDPAMSIVLALFFVKAPVKTITRSMLELLDVVPGRNIQDKVKEVVEQYKPRSFGIHRLRYRKAGRKIFLDICFIVHGNLTVNKIEELANSFERDLAARLPNCDVVVYFKHPV